MRKLLKTPQDVERRKLFKAVASSGISMSALRALPFGMGLMYSRAGLAAETGISKAVFVYIPDGAPPGTYTMNGTSLGETATPLQSMLSNVVMFSDCNSNVGNHGNTFGTMRADGNGPTLDVQLENAIGGTSPFSILRVGTECNTGQGLMSSNSTFVDNPQVVFERLFSGNAPEGPALEAAKRVLERNRAEVASLKKKLGSFELKRLEEHEAAINALEIRLTPEPVVGCDSFSSSWTPFGGATTGQFTKISNLHVDLIVEAFRCNLTNLACFQLGTHQAEHEAPDSGYAGSYHGSIHGGGPGDYAKARRYLTERLAYLIERLKATPDPSRSDGGSLLDSTIVLQVTDMGDGGAHNGVNAPFTIASGKHINGGRYLSGATNNTLLNTVSKALGAEGLVSNFGGEGVTESILKI